MKKWKLFSAILLLLMIINVTSLYATDGSQTNPPSEEVVVDDQKTPEVIPRNRYVAPLLFVTAIVIVGYMYQQGYLRNKNQLYICTVELNNDGSMTVTCGYHSKNSIDHVSQEDNEVKIQQGTAIILNKDTKRDKSLVAIINENTKIIWKFKNQSLEIDGNKLRNKEKEDLWEKH
jgi:hypothetical protein